MRRILVIRLSAIGDVLLATLLVRRLKRRFPDARIDFLVKEAYAPLLRSNPNIDAVLTFFPERGFSEISRVSRQIRADGYDAVVDLQASPRSFLLRFFSGAGQQRRHRPRRWRRFLLVHFGVDAYKNIPPIPLRYLESVAGWGVEDDGLGLDLEITVEDRASLLGLLRSEGFPAEGRMIVLAPGAGRATKRWRPEGFAEVAVHFFKRGCRVVLAGGFGDRGICDTINRMAGGKLYNVSGACSLTETAALLDMADLMITNDTGVMHMASALGKKVVALFGPTSRQLGFYPFRTDATVVERPLTCRPCSYHGTEKCPKGHFRCMKEIQSADVIDAAETLLKRK